MSGSSGGSGGSSGKVDYPEYMKTQHETWLNDVDTDMGTVSGNNPYTAATAYDPDCALNATNYVISQFYDMVIAIDPSADWGTYFDTAAGKYTTVTLAAISDYTFDTIFEDANLSDLVDAYQTDMEARRDNDFKPAFKAGMQNINAVMSSAFVVGDMLITSEVSRNVAKFSGDLYFQNEQKKLEYQNAQANENTQHNQNLIAHDQLEINQDLKEAEIGLSGGNQIMSTVLNQHQLGTSIAQLTAEANRVKIVAKQEETDKNIRYDKMDALWDLELYTYAGNVLSSISGTAVSTPGSDETSTGASVLGGAMAGAAMGGTVGGPWGAAIGGVVGGIGGLLG